ncbi:UDP-glucose 6-dehydrogenase [Tritrichomonas foetus]|uniref:UDP-glucose 6-dehydrogenase n=1 Tax=Tritrichomonas foetus TaxID=1144522 RepID=A0A1J4KKZ3_9EUKA|nr:UDP-glucose 6-dehydrogenase [Tritrichomonas foetus]|eukprot:OHT10045.1 UDP-glucose 6-dehydrogenase [Tritrichomonas foetus]
MTTVKNIVCVGAGYVGGPTMAVIAEKCPDIEVTVVDVDERKIEAWKHSPLPIKEPKLEEIVESCRQRNLHFSTDIKSAIEIADLIFIAVGTPTKLVGTGAGKAALIDYVESAARTIGKYATKNTIVVEKSTVPVGVSRSIKTVLNANSANGIKFQILSNPEFLAEGTAIDDLHAPDRILIGHEESPAGRAAADVLISVYAHWVPRERILVTNTWSSELSKLTANAFLAQRISSINAISAICEKTGANVNEVARACGADVRIGSKFLKASVGFGGSCFQKDVLNLVYIAESLGLTEVANYWNSVISMNNYQRKRFANDIVHTMFDTLLNKTLAIFGFAFKADTGDTRESSSIYVCSMLLAEGAILNIYDPKVTKQQMYDELKYLDDTLTQERFDKNVHVFDDPYKCTESTHALVVMTEWPCFKTYDYSKIYSSMMKPAFVFDGRNILNREELRSIGFCTHGIGVSPDHINP